MFQCLFENNSRYYQIIELRILFSRSLTLSENRYGLRTILSPSELPAKFMKIAQSNTDKNIETCGVLFGKVVSCEENFASKEGNRTHKIHDRQKF